MARHSSRIPSRGWPAPVTIIGITAAADNENNAAAERDSRSEDAVADLVEGSIPADSDDRAIEVLGSPRFCHRASVSSVLGGHELHVAFQRYLQLPERSRAPCCRLVERGDCRWQR